LHSDNTLNAQFVFKRYAQFRLEMREEKNMRPRKVVKCPPSQFNFGGNFSESDYRSESFRFIGSSNVPYTTNGRNYQHWGGEGQIKALINWKAEPLELSL
jgi:hypothetical protein